MAALFLLLLAQAVPASEIKRMIGTIKEGKRK